MPTSRQVWACRVRAVAVVVVGHQPLDGDAPGGKPGDRAPQKRDAGALALVGQDLDVGQPHVHELPAGAPAADTTVARHAMTGQRDAGKLLDVAVDQLAWPRALISVLRLGVQPRQAAEAFALEHR